MRKTKTMVAFCLAIIMAFSLTAVPVSAKGTDASALSRDLRTYVKLDEYIFTHLPEDVEIVRDIVEGNTSSLDKYITDPEERELFLRVLNLPMTEADVIKTTAIMVNPKNSEQNRTLTMNVAHSDKKWESVSKNGKVLAISLLSSGRSSEKKMDLYPFLAYQNTNNELVVLATVTNNTDSKVQLTGIPYIELLSGGKAFASGNAESFDTPMTFAPRSRKGGTGIYDGLPDRCFLRITFAPGTYDNNIDISNLDNVNSVYAMDYTVLK